MMIHRIDKPGESVPEAQDDALPISDTSPAKSDLLPPELSEEFKRLRASIHVPRHPAFRKANEQTDWSTVALKVAHDLLSDEPWVAVETLDTIKNNFLYVPEEQRFHFAQIIVQADKNDAEASHPMLTHALGSMLSYFDDPHHRMVANYLIEKLIRDQKEQVVILKSLQMADFQHLEPHVRNRVIEHIFQNILQGSDKVRVASRNLLASQFNNLTAGDQEYILRRVDNHLYQDWQAQGEMIHVVQDVFIHPKPIHIKEKRIVEGVAFLLGHSNWSTTAACLSLIEKNPNYFESKKIIDKILVCCRDERSQVAEAAVRALLKMASLSSGSDHRSMIDAMVNTEDGPLSSTQKVRGMEALVALAPFVSGFHQIIIAGQLVYFIQDQDGHVVKKAVSLLQDLLNSFSAEKPWQMQRMQKIVVHGSGKKFRSQFEAHSYFLLNPDLITKKSKKAVTEFLNPKYADVTETNHVKVLSLVEVLLLNNSAVGNGGLWAAKEVASQMVTADQQRRMMEMIDHVAVSTKTGELLRSMVLSRMPEPVFTTSRAHRQGVAGGALSLAAKPFRLLAKIFR